MALQRRSWKCIYNYPSHAHMPHSSLLTQLRRASRQARGCRAANFCCRICLPSPVCWRNESGLCVGAMNRIFLLSTFRSASDESLTTNYLSAPGNPQRQALTAVFLFRAANPVIQVARLAGNSQGSAPLPHIAVEYSHKSHLVIVDHLPALKSLWARRAGFPAWADGISQPPKVQVSPAYTAL